MTTPDRSSASSPGITVQELRELPRERRQAILAAAAQMAQHDYCANMELTGFDAFAEEEREDDESP